MLLRRLMWVSLGYVLLFLGAGERRSVGAENAAPAPTNFRGEALGADRIHWQWDDTLGETRYELHNDQHDVIAVIPSDVTSFVESGLSENTQYSRHVHASEFGILSPPSNSDAKYTLVHDPTTADFTVNATSPHTIDIDVVPPPNPLADKTGVRIVRNTPTVKEVSPFGPVYEATDDGLDPDTEYCYSIQFRNGDGIETAFAPSSICVRTPQEECREQTSFKTSVTFGGSGKADIIRPSPDKQGDKNFIEYKWAASKKKNFTKSQDRKKCCKDTIIEAFAGPDVPTATDFNVDEKGDQVGLGAGVNTGPTENRIGLAFAIVVSCCERFSFTNVITTAKFRIFRSDGTAVRIKAKNTGDGQATVDNAFIWPRISVLEERVVAGQTVPVSGAFWDNPAFRDVKPSNQLIEGLKAGAQDTKYDNGSVINDETDFLTAVYCDEDNNPATIPSRKGAETLCAVVRWGYKAQVQVGSKPENNRGKVFAKPVKIICGPGPGEEPSQDFKDAKARLDKAFNDNGAINLFTGKASDWVFEK